MMNNKLRKYITISTAVVLLSGGAYAIKYFSGVGENKANVTANSFLQGIFKDEKEKDKEKVSMYLGATNAKISVLDNLKTFEKSELPRGLNVTRVGEIIEVEKEIPKETPKETSMPEKTDTDKIKKESDDTKKTEKEDVAISENTDGNKNQETSTPTEKTKLPVETLKYYQVEYTNMAKETKTGYVEPEFLVATKDESIKEKKVFVRTPTHLYSDNKDAIVTLIDKGTNLEVTGYDELDNLTGLVSWYKVKVTNTDKSGYVRSKYVVNSHEEAILIYNENNIMDIHNKRNNRFGAGAANQLDFYPRKKVAFEDNVMPEEVKALYINSGSIKSASKYIEVAKGTKINAFVVDIKDNGSPSFPAKAMEKYSPKNFQMAKKYFNTEEEYATGIKKLKDAGFYVIGRITVFKDAYYVKDHPEHAITDTRTNKPFLHNKTYWPSGYQRDVWKFNVELAKEAVTKFNFNEIQFDYIRFPDGTRNYEKRKQIDFKNEYGETKSQAIQRFAMYAVDEIHELNAYVSGDVFGESAHQYVTSYGQYWGALTNVLDVISPMSYPDHFDAGNYGFKYPWLEPYKLINYWSKMAVTRQSDVPTPAVIRPWIQSHNAGKKPAKKYQAKEVSDQLRGYYDAGIDGGFMTWWSSSSIAGYESEKSAYAKDYK